MKTKTYNLYKYDELTLEQKEKAIDKNRDINVDFDFESYTLEYETERLDTLGYNAPKISYSGFCSQGDGASFTATGDISKLVKKTYQKYIDTITFTKNDNLYSHEYTMSIEIEYTDEPEPHSLAHTEYFNNLENTLLKDAREQARTIYKALESEYNDLTSDETISETLRANDYDITITGVIE